MFDGAMPHDSSAISFCQADICGAGRGVRHRTGRIARFVARTGNVVVMEIYSTQLASSRLYRRFQALEGLAEGDREAIIKVIDAMVVKHQTTRAMEEVGK